jgi:hypothetical protein
MHGKAYRCSPLCAVPILASVVDPKTFFSDSDPQKFYSDSDTDSTDIYFGTNNSKVFFQWPTNISEYNTTKKNFVAVKIYESLYLTLVFVMLYY